MARPKTDDPKARAKILAAAEKLFADRGYSGTTIRHIASSARVNGAMIHYYFGNKQGLYHTILESAAAKVRSLLIESNSLNESARDMLAGFADAYAAYILRQPNMARILYREMLAGGAHLKQVASRYAVSNYTLLRETMVEGIRTGELRPIDVDLAPVSLMGMIVIFQFLQPIVTLALGKDRYDNRFIKRLSAHTIDLFFNGAANCASAIAPAAARPQRSKLKDR